MTSFREGCKKSHCPVEAGGISHPSVCIWNGRVQDRRGQVHNICARKKIPPCFVRSRSQSIAVSGGGCASRPGSQHNRRRRRKCCVTHYTLQARWWARGLPSGLPSARLHRPSPSGIDHSHTAPALTERTPKSCFAFFAVLSPTPAALSFSMTSRWGFGPSERS